MTADARTALVLGVVALGLAGCNGADGARSLDRICAKVLDEGPACEVAGVGERTTGVTGDAVGFTLDDASLVVHLAAVPDLRAPKRFDISLLTAARDPATPLDFALTWGSCPQGCPASPAAAATELPTELTWVPVATGVPGSATDAVFPYDAVMTFTALEFEIVDLRITESKRR
jgi:hypothetical protein